jgi:hypothetical protein
MRTENDLRAALQHRADQAPEVAQALIARALVDQHRPSPTRARLSIAVAVAIVAALIAVPLAIRQAVRNSSTPSPATSSGPPAAKKVTALSWVTPPTANWTERLLFGDPNQENIFVHVPSPAGGNELIVTDFPPGGFDTGQLAGAKPVTVDGHRGYYGQLTTLTGPKPTSGLRYYPVVGPHTALAWEIAPDQWVVLSDSYYAAPHLTESQLVSVATGLGMQARSRPAGLPFKIGYLPGAPWQLHIVNLGNKTTTIGTYVLIRGNTELDVAVGGGPFALPPGGLAGHVGRFPVGIFQYDVGTERPVSRIDQATLAKIAHSIVVASPSDRDSSSWFPVDQVMP